MEFKDIRKIILFCICVFAIGFGCLVYYYIDYSKDTENRNNNMSYENEIINQQDIINKLESEKNQIDSTKFGETEKEYEYKDYNMDAYDEYVKEQLMLKTDKTEEETRLIYEEAMKDIRLKVLSGQYTEAASVAYETMANTVFPDGKQYANLTSIKSISGYEQLSDIEKTFILDYIKDPVVYVSLFYALAPEYQVEILGEENFLFVPSQNDNQIGLINLSEAGPIESKASKYFSNLENIDMYEVEIEVMGIKYKVYVAGEQGYPYRITYVEFSDPTNRNYSNYTDYFNVWGRQEIEIYYD